jgi:Ca-activated chloride channel family protein
VPDKVRVGAIAFNHGVRVLQTPTTDRVALREAIDTVKPAGSTATGEALSVAIQVAQRPTTPGGNPPPAAIVLLSDGKSVKGRDPIEIAREAAEAKIPIYTISLGTPNGTIDSRRKDGTIFQEPVPPDPETMRQVSEISGGRAFAVDDAAALDTIYERLGSQITRKKVKREVTAGFAGGALALMLVGGALGLRFFGRVL